MNATPDTAVLNVGSGNSPLPFVMWGDGYTNLTNIDISDKAIEVMKEQAATKGIGGKWLEMDATKMSFQNDTFDIVVDKGTLDALVCADDKSIPIDLMKEMYRVCKPDGCMYLITHCSPELRRDFLSKCYEPDTTEINYCQQSLRGEVNMVNIMRSIGNGKPLREVMKTPKMFLECLLEMKRDADAANKLGGDWRDYSWTTPGEIVSGLIDNKTKVVEEIEEIDDSPVDQDKVS